MADGVDDEDQYFIKLAYKFSKPSASQYPLLHATCNGDLERMKELLREGEDINQKNDQKITAVWCACYHGNNQALQLLLENKADPDIADIYEQTPLFVACYQGNFENIQLLITYGCTLTCRDYEKHTALHSASDAGREEIIRFLIATDNEQRKQALALGLTIDETPLVNLQDINFNTALHYAAANNQMECVDALLSGDALADLKNAQQKTPLHIACELGHDFVVDILIDEGADINALEEDGRTPLHIACAEGKQQCVDLLVSNGADLTIIDSLGLTALHLAALNNHIDVVRLLCQGIEVEDGNNTIRAVDPNLLDGFSRNAIHAAAEAGNISLCELLNQFGTNVNHLDRFGRSALHYCSIWGDVNCFEWFINHGVSVNQKDHLGRTPLHYVCYFGNFIGANALLQNGADIDLPDLNGETPLLASLHEFDNNDKSEIVELLIEYEAKTSMVEHRGRSALHICASTGDVETLELLLEAHVEEILRKKKLSVSQQVENKISAEFINQPSNLGHTSLHYAVVNKQLDNFEFLIQRDGDPNAKDHQGNTVLMWAIKSGSVECFNLIMEECNVDLEECNKNGDNALTVAISGGRYEFVQKILEVNPQLASIPTLSGRSPLDIAVYHGDPSILTLLIFYSSKVMNFNGADNHGRNAAHRASRIGNVEILTTLLKNGTNINAADADGVTPLMYAAFYGHTDCINYLIQNGADETLTDKKNRTYKQYLLHSLASQTKGETNSEEIGEATVENNNNDTVEAPVENNDNNIINDNNDNAVETEKVEIENEAVPAETLERCDQEKGEITIDSAEKKEELEVENNERENEPIVNETIVIVQEYVEIEQTKGGKEEEKDITPNNVVEENRIDKNEIKYIPTSQNTDTTKPKVTLTNSKQIVPLPFWRRFYFTVPAFLTLSGLAYLFFYGKIKK